ncbi:MAG TPA: glycosyltransferase [Pyrinomonadaceae bacterium]|nr:glycosyltransferase [Pyrinomonadaceae bacterium]
MADASGWADFWTVAFAKLGYVMTDVISNTEPMQKAWANENGIDYTEADWLFDITTAQVIAFQPDVLFFNDYVTYTAAYLKHLRSVCPSIKLIFGWCGAPYRDGSVFSAYDIVLSSVPELVQHFRDQGHRSVLVNHAFEPRVLAQLDRVAATPVDFAFIGSIAKKAGFHHEREALLLRLLEETPLQLWASVTGGSWRLSAGIRSRQLMYDSVHAARRIGVPEAMLNTGLPGKALKWKERPSLPPAVHPRLVRAARAPVFGLEMYAQLAHSRVTLNSHIDMSEQYASNMRLYEATGVASCLLTDWRPNMPELFEPDTEVVTYKNAEECIEKVKYLLDHEEQRQAIGRAGQKRTLRDHTFDNRAIQLDDLIRAEVR